MARPKLAAVLAETDKGPGVREISTDEASVLSKLGMSGAGVNDKARRAVTYFLEALTLKTSIDDDEAKACLDVLKKATTVEQKELCNRVLAMYVSKFDFAQPGAYNAGKVSKVTAEKEAAVVA